MLLAVMGAYAWSAQSLPETAARAFTFCTLVAGNLALIFSNRSSTASMWSGLRVRNRALWWVTGATLGLLALVVYQPYVAGLFYFSALPAGYALAAAVLGLSGVVWFEGIKWVLRRSARRKHTQRA